MTEAEFRKILGDNIQKYRQQLGLTQEKTAEMAGMSPGHLADVINGRRWPSPSMILKISQALGVQPYELFLPPQHSEGAPYDRDRLRDWMTEVKDSLTSELESKIRRFLDSTSPDSNTKPPKS